jgi:hypothetical protein
MMKLFTSIYDDTRLLGPFLRHYNQYRISEFFIAVAPDVVSTVKEFMGRYPITLFERHATAVQFIDAAHVVNEMREIHHQDNEWAVVVDLDEFVEFAPDIDHFLSIAERENANVVRGIMYDRFGADGELVNLDHETDLPSLLPIKARFIHHVTRGCDHKGVLVKGRLKPAGAHHFFHGEKPSSEILEISHYRWLTGTIDKLKARYAVLSDVGTPWSIEYKRIIDHYEQRGRFAWEEFGGVSATVGKRWPTTETQNINLALNRPACQSSTSEWSWHAVPQQDARGGNNGCLSDERGFHTAIEWEPWWQVDLGDGFLVRKVVIFNRQHMAHRLRHFSLLKSLDGVGWTIFFRKTDDAVFGASDGNPYIAYISGDHLARFVRLRLDGQDWLHFRECQIFGDWADSVAQKSLQDDQGHLLVQQTNHEGVR